MSSNDASLPADTDEHRWIVGVDGSEIAEHALQWAVVHGNQRPTSLRVVHVWQALIGDPSPPAPSQQLDRTTDAVLSRMRDVVQAHRGTAEFAAEYGNPARRLVELAHDADLLVVGTRGLGGFHRLLLGSTSHQCAAHSTVPVVVVPPTTPIAEDLRRIVVGIDGSPNAMAALRWALRFASPTTTIEAVGAWEPSPLATKADAERLDELSSRTRESFIESIGTVEATERSDLEVQRVFENGKPAAVLNERAATADLLVVGARGRGGIGSTLLGSVSYKVLHRSTIPVVIVPDTAGWEQAPT